MRKIQLDLASLHVESFDVQAGSGRRGTVQGREWTFTGICCPSPTEVCTGIDNSCSGQVACICDSGRGC